MKKSLKFTKRLSQKSTKPRHRIRGVKHTKKNIKSKISYEIQSPYNSNNFLISNQSSPFYEENEEMEFYFQPTELTNIDLYSDIKDFISYKMESTYDESDMEEKIQKEKNNEIIC